MHDRIIAFFISSNEVSLNSHKKAKKHLHNLADSFARNIHYVKLAHYHLYLVFEGNINRLLQKEANCTKFCVGPHTSRSQSGWGFSFNKRKSIRDRFLHIGIDNEKISVSNDYIGSIPVYYSLRKYVSISNIEPVVVLDSESCYEDIIPEAVYELFRYTHFIETETFYRHIRTQMSDSTYTFTCDSKTPITRYNKTICSSEDRINMSPEDIVEEMHDINQKLVWEALQDEKDIILPLSSGYDSRMILAAAIKNKDIKSRLRCYTYTPNMSLETRAAKELSQIAGVKWEKIQLPDQHFDLRKLEQVGLIFGSGLHFHGKYKLDFLDQINTTFTPGQSIITEGFMTGISTGSSFICDLNIQDSKTPLTNAMDIIGTSRFTRDEYFLPHSKILHLGMKDYAEANMRKVFERFDGPINHKMTMFDIWARERNFFSYQPRVMEWGIPYISPHTTPEFLNFTFSLPPQILRKRKLVEMTLAKYSKPISRVSTNSILTVRSILKRSFSRPEEGISHYAPLLIKYFFKQHWLLPKELLDEMKDPTVPNLCSIGKRGVAPIFELNKQSQEIFNEYFDLKEADNLLSLAMTGDALSSKRLTILQTLAYALKLVE